MRLIYSNTRLCFIMLITALTLIKCRPSVTQEKWDINQGYVPDSTTAVQIAEILFVRIYGEKVLEKKPFVATFKDGIWIVDGTLEKGMDGGVPHVEIQKADGKIIDLFHGK